VKGSTVPQSSSCMSFKLKAALAQFTSIQVTLNVFHEKAFGLLKMHRSACNQMIANVNRAVFRRYIYIFVCLFVVIHDDTLKFHFPPIKWNMVGNELHVFQAQRTNILQDFQQ